MRTTCPSMMMKIVATQRRPAQCRASRALFMELANQTDAAERQDEFAGFPRGSPNHKGGSTAPVSLCGLPAQRASMAHSDGRLRFANVAAGSLPAKAGFRNKTGRWDPQPLPPPGHPRRATARRIREG